MPNLLLATMLTLLIVSTLHCAGRSDALSNELEKSRMEDKRKLQDEMLLKQEKEDTRVSRKRKQRRANEPKKFMYPDGSQTIVVRVQ